jgi:hypothetical protein
MGRVQVREIIQAQIAALDIPNVGFVYAARPIILSETDYTQQMNATALTYAGTGFGCVIVVNLPDDRRTRIALTGLGSVNDFQKHKLALEIWFASVGGDGVAAQYAYDAIVDALIVAIRANQVPGPSGVIWMGGGEVGTGIDHAMGQPYSPDDGLSVFIQGAIRYDVWEQLVGVDV